MAGNNSVVGNESLMRRIHERVILVEVLVILFICINSMMIATFIMRDFFYTTMRYILFANTLVADCLFLIVTNIMLIMYNLQFPIQMCFCLIMFIMSSLCFFVTPITLTAMSVERYVAICMPLRHAELCTTRNSLNCILIIHGLSSIPFMVTLSSFFASVTHNIYTQYKICSVELLTFQSWQSNLRSAVSQLFFLIMLITIVFSYVEIMKVAKAASGENKKSSWRGVRTVILHAFQLLLCLVQLWCPFIEAAVVKIDFLLFVNIRYLNYVIFTLVSRCLSPLVYGLRDEKFSLALKFNFLCGFVKTSL